MTLVDKYGGSTLMDSVNPFDSMAYDATKVVEWIKYHLIFEDYIEFLKVCSEYLKEISIPNNSISTAINISTLFKNGFFSYKKPFESDDSNNIFQSNLGINTVYGKGVCRHISSFAVDLLSKSDIYADKFICYATDTTIETTLMGEANHMSTLIEYDGAYYLYDVPRDLMLRFVSPIKAESYSGVWSFHYKPLPELSLGTMNISDVEDRLKKFEESVSKSISGREYREIEVETRKLSLTGEKDLENIVRDKERIKKKIYTQILDNVKT